MLSQTDVEKGFQYLLESVELLQGALDTSFFDAYIENSENRMDSQKVRVIDGVPNKDAVEKIETLYNAIEQLELTQEDRRKITQLVLLKGSMKDGIQANHQLTPDGIGFLFVYILEQLAGKTKETSLLDISVGMGNLLYTIVSNLDVAGIKATGYGVDVDDTLLNVAAVNQSWLDIDAQLFHQDSIDPLLVDPVDFAIADLPIGFYPVDEKAKTFTVAASQGHTYAHHLLMEKAMDHVKSNGFGIFLVPSNLLETEQAPLLTKWLQEKVYLQSVLKLPDSLFSQKGISKSIFIVQNRGEAAVQAKEVLLAELPSLKDNKAVLTFINSFSTWRQTNIK